MQLTEYHLPKNQVICEMNGAVNPSNSEWLIIVAHDFKHVKSNDHRPTSRAIPISFALYGRMGYNTHAYNDTGQLPALGQKCQVAKPIKPMVHTTISIIGNIGTPP